MTSLSKIIFELRVRAQAVITLAFFVFVGQIAFAEPGIGTVTSNVPQRSANELTIYTRHRWGEKQFAIHGSSPSYCMVATNPVSQDGHYQVVSVPSSLLRESIFFSILNWKGYSVMAYVSPDYGVDGKPIAFYEVSSRISRRVAPPDLHINNATFDIVDRLLALAELHSHVSPYEPCLTGAQSHADVLIRLNADIRQEMEALLPLWLADERRVLDRYDEETTKIDVLFIHVLGEWVRSRLD